MSDEIQTDVEPVDPPVTVEPETEDNEQLVEEARKYGWRDKSEFDLAPEGWVDAERFMELPSTQKKQLRDELRAEREEREKMSRDFDERVARMERANQEANRRALDAQKQQFEAELDRIREAKRAAVEVADVTAYATAEKREAELREREPKPVSQQLELSPEDEATLRDFEVRNPWIRANPAYQKMAHAMVEANPNVKMAGIKAQLDFVEQNKSRIAPEIFPATTVADPPKPKARVDGGGLGGGAKTLASRLPPEAKAAAKEFIEQGLYKSVEEYAGVYFEGEQA